MITTLTCFAHTVAFEISNKSTKVNAAIASTTGTALGSTQGSCRPLTCNSTACLLVSRFLVF